MLKGATPIIRELLKERAKDKKRERTKSKRLGVV